MKKGRFLIFVFLSLAASSFFGQTHWCAFDQMDSLYGKERVEFEDLMQNLQARPTALTPNQVYRIPVVVHVVHNNSIDEVGLKNNISDKQIFSAIEVLNEDFRRKNADTIYTPSWAKPVAADFQLEFVLATQDPNGLPTNGITRHRTDRSSFSISSSDEKELKAYGYWPSDQYLNIWVASLSGNVVGYAQFPDNTGLAGINNVNGTALTDGVVIAPFAFGRLSGVANGANNPYRFGRSCVHEIGHWVGLKHIFNSDETGCNYSDYCNDTPPQNKSNIGLSTCDTTIVGECNAVLMFMNYMDYTNDACMNIFTEDQKSRAHKVMEISPRRAALKFSKGLCGSTNKMVLPYLENFEDEVSFLKDWKLSGESDTASWVFENGVLKGVSAQDSQDSLVLASGVMDYKNSENYTLRFNVLPEINNSDSIKIYYEWACSAQINLLKTIYLENNQTLDEQLKLNGLFQDGLIKFYFVIYSNGNSIGLDDITIYQEVETLDVSVYPNPSTGLFSYNLKLTGDQKLDLQVYNLQGELVFSRSEEVFSGKYAMDLSYLSSSTYIARFTTESDSKTIKIIVE